MKTKATFTPCSSEINLCNNVLWLLVYCIHAMMTMMWIRIAFATNFGSSVGSKTQWNRSSVMWEGRNCMAELQRHWGPLTSTIVNMSNIAWLFKLVQMFNNLYVVDDFRILILLLCFSFTIYTTLVLFQ